MIGVTAGESDAALEDLLSIQHVLQAVAQRQDVVRVVLRLEHHAVVRGRRERDGAVDRRRREGGDRNLSLLERRGSHY